MFIPACGGAECVWVAKRQPEPAPGQPECIERLSLPSLLVAFNGAAEDVAVALLGCGLPLTKQRHLAEAWLRLIDAREHNPMSRLG